MAIKDAVKKRKAVLSSNGEALTPEDTLGRFMKDFVFELKGKNSTEGTIEAYVKQFKRVCQFVGIYETLEEEAVADAMVNIKNNKQIREEFVTTGLLAPISSLDVEDIGNFYYEYLAKHCGISEQTIITAMRNFRVFYYWLMHKGLVRQQKITVKVVEPPIKDLYTDAEIKQLTHTKPAIEQMVEYRNWLMVMYLISTGNRIGSVLEIKVGDIDFAANEIRVQHTKTRKPQVMALQHGLKKLFAEWIKAYRSDDDNKPLNDEYLFCNTFGGKLSYDAASDAMQDYFKLNGVRWRGFHMFRHTYAHHWIVSGGDCLTLKTALGHKSLQMTSRYSNLYGKSVSKDVDKFGLQNVVEVTAGRSRLKAKK